MQKRPYCQFAPLALPPYFRRSEISAPVVQFLPGISSLERSTSIPSPLRYVSVSVTFASRPKPLPTPLGTVQIVRFICEYRIVMFVPVATPVCSQSNGYNTRYQTIWITSNPSNSSSQTSFQSPSSSQNDEHKTRLDATYMRPSSTPRECAIALQCTRMCAAWVQLPRTHNTQEIAASSTAVCR